MKITLMGIPFEYTVERKKNNKRTYCHIQGNHHLKICANSSISDKEIEEFILSKDKWIVEKDDSLTKHQKTLTVVDTTTVVLFGQTVNCKLVLGANNQAVVKDGQLIVTVKKMDSKAIEAAVYDYGKKMMLAHIESSRYQWDTIVVNDYHLEKPVISVKRLSSKWGVCTPSKNSICLSVYLCHYDYSVIDAVLWHEYAHLIVPNHSKRFYDVIRYHMPDYEIRHAKLKQ